MRTASTPSPMPENVMPARLARSLVSRLFIGLALVALAAPATHGQKPLTGDAALLARYRLTEGTFKKYVQVNKALVALAKDPAMQRYAAEHENDKAPETIAEMAAQFDAVPPLKKAIHDAGLTSREFALFSMSLLQAGMALGVLESGATKLPEGTPKENVDFVRAHRAEIEQIQRELSAASESAATGPDPSGTLH